MDQDFPIFQWSKFSNGGKEEQYVVRANDITAFKKAKGEILQEIAQEAFINEGSFKAPMTTGAERMAQGASALQSKTCTVHNVPMVKAFSQAKQKDYFYHDTPEGKCFGHR